MLYTPYALILALRFIICSATRCARGGGGGGSSSVLLIASTFLLFM